MALVQKTLENFNEKLTDVIIHREKPLQNAITPEKVLEYFNKKEEEKKPETKTPYAIKTEKVLEKLPEIPEARTPPMSEEDLLSLTNPTREEKLNPSLNIDSILNYDVFGSYHDIFIWIKGLKDSGAVIAGGSILSMIINKDSIFVNDFDVYVNLKNSQIIYDAIIKLGYVSINSHLSPAYDQSFFKKNKILSRFSFRNTINKRKPPIDLMIINDDVSVNSVVTNFDLSFCEIWFDGENVYSNDPESITTKTGYLKKDYAEYVFTYFNKFIIKRIKKYTKRGFKIKYECLKDIFIDSLLGVKSDIKTIKNPKGIKCPNLVNIKDPDPVYPEEWVVKKIYQTFLNIQCKDDFILYKIFNLKEYTVEDLFSILKKFYHITNGSLWIINNGILSNIEEPEKNRIRDEHGRLTGLNPELNDKRIKKKIKFIIKFLLCNFLSYTDENNPDWFKYFNCVLNKDENDTIDEFGENFYVNFQSVDIDENDRKLLSDVIYIRDLENFQIYNSGYDTNILYSNEIRLQLIEYFFKLNIRYELSLKFSNINISKDLEIIEGDSFDTVTIDYFLDQDVNNLVFLFNSGDIIKGVGINKNSLNDIYNRLIVKCKQEYFGTIDIERIIDEWYMILPIGDSYNNGVLLSKLNVVKDQLEKGYKIFLLTERELAYFVASVNNVDVDNTINYYRRGRPRPNVNVMAIPINTVSGTHCSNGTQTYVYNDIFIVDENYVSEPDTNIENNYTYLSTTFPYLSKSTIDKMSEKNNVMESDSIKNTNYDSEEYDLDNVARRLNYDSELESDIELESDVDNGSKNILNLDKDDSSDEEIFIPYYDDSENEI